MPDRDVDDAFENRLTVRPHRVAYAYWRSLNGDNLPSRTDLDPLQIIPILPLVNLVDVVLVDGGYRFRHRLVGTELVQRFNAEHTGMWFDELYRPEHLDVQLPSYIEAAEERRPTIGAVMLEENGISLMAYRRLILPLQGTEGGIDCLFVVFASEDIRQQVNERRRRGLPLHQDDRGSNV